MRLKNYLTETNIVLKLRTEECISYIIKFNRNKHCIETRGEIIQSQKDFVINHKIWKEMFKNIQGVKYDYYRIRKKT